MQMLALRPPALMRLRISLRPGAGIGKVRSMGTTGDSGIDEAGQKLVNAANHLRAADQDLRMLLTLLRQQKREVPPAVEETIGLVADALMVLET